MATEKQEWLNDARIVKKAASVKGSPEVFLQAVFPGKPLTLEYRNLKLRVKDLDEDTIQILRRSGVPRYLHNATYKDWGGHTPAVLYVHGKIVRSRKDENTRRFIAYSAHGKDGKEYHNQLTTIHLLFARGFYTPLLQSSWMRTDEVQPKTLRARLEAKKDNRVENGTGKAFSARAPIALRLYDCMGWGMIGKSGKRPETKTKTSSKSKVKKSKSSK